MSTLVAAQPARGLFAKAIGESGAAFTASPLGYGTVDERSKKDQEWVDTLGVKSLAELRALPADKILASVKGDPPTKPGYGFGPDIDGKLLTEPVPDTFAAGKQAHVPLLAGWNRDEGSFFAMHGMTAEQWKGMAAGLFKDRSDEVSEALRRQHRRSGSALGHRLRQRLVHRPGNLEVA